MTSLARYHARAPRYILNTQDNALIRLSGAEQLSWEESTEIQDISLTGLAFTAPQDLSPQIGEVIKIQFSVPSSEQMACYAVVIRIQNKDDDDNLIAVHFYKLDRLQRLNIVQGLAHKVKLHQTENVSPPSRPLWSFVILAALIFSLTAWLSIMKYFFLAPVL